jgi:hypothetical protein
MRNMCDSIPVDSEPFFKYPLAERNFLKYPEVHASI